MPKTYYFIKRDRKINQIGAEYSHWAVSFQCESKKDLVKTYTRGTAYVKPSEVYSPKQLIEKFSSKKIREILDEIKKFQPELRKQS